MNTNNALALVAPWAEVDLTLRISHFEVKFISLFPVSLSSLDFDSTTADNEYFSADVTFKYLMYNIVDKNGNAL